jgi:MFS family permease
MTQDGERRPEAGKRDQKTADIRTLLAVSADVRFLFLARIVRLFAYGALSVVLVLYLFELGLESTQIGLLLTLTLVGDSAVSLWLTVTADRIGRKKMLIAGAVLVVFAGVIFVSTRNFLVLVIAATIGVISPSGNEVGPFLSIEQAALSQIVSGQRRTSVFAWYNLAGSFATAAGALVGGAVVQVLLRHGLASLDGYRAVVIGYAMLGAALAALFTRLSAGVELERATVSAGPASMPWMGLHGSHRIVFKLAAFFSLDAFAGGFVIQSLVAYWFFLKFGVEPAVLGSIFFGANVLAGLSALSAARVASRIGLVNTMVFTHLPSNLLLILVPLMPSLPLAVLVLFLRFSISQMDVPTRQAYTMAVVKPEERSAAAGITGIFRSMGAAISPVLAGPLLVSPALGSALFFVAGGLKIIYDLLLYRNFRAVKPRD